MKKEVTTGDYITAIFYLFIFSNSKFGSNAFYDFRTRDDFTFRIFLCNDTVLLPLLLLLLLLLFDNGIMHNAYTEKKCILENNTKRESLNE